MTKVCVKYDPKKEVYKLKTKTHKVYITRYDFLKNPAIIRETIKELENEQSAKT